MRNSENIKEYPPSVSLLVLCGSWILTSVRSEATENHRVHDNARPADRSDDVFPDEARDDWIVVYRRRRLQSLDEQAEFHTVVIRDS